MDTFGGMIRTMIKQNPTPTIAEALGQGEIWECTMNDWPSSITSSSIIEAIIDNIIMDTIIDRLYNFLTGYKLRPEKFRGIYIPIGFMKSDTSMAAMNSARRAHNALSDRCHRLDPCRTAFDDTRCCRAKRFAGRAILISDIKSS
jgi:hypothetical protein